MAHTCPTYTKKLSPKITCHVYNLDLRIGETKVLMLTLSNLTDNFKYIPKTAKLLPF
jgi:hypothetical protein